MELYDITLSEGAQPAVDLIADTFEIPKKKAKQVLANALIYNCVIEEIMGQCAWLLNKEMDGDS